MTLSRRNRRIATAAPVALLAVTLALNPAAILRRMSSTDPTITTTAVTPGRHITILGSGDILIHPPTWQQARDDARKAHRDGYLFDPMLDQIRTAVTGADLAICHMETPIADTPPEDFPAFSAPTDIIPAIEHTGYDGCSTASNHAFDHGEQGIRTTITAMDAAGLPHTGTYTTEQASHQPLIYTVNGVKIASLSFATMFNESRGKHRPADKPWMANKLSDPGSVTRAAREARAAGADIVVLSAHWGTELSDTPSNEQQRLAQVFTQDPNIDLIIGHHTHSVQPVEMINGKWVAYSVGNLLARHDFPNDINRQGIITRFTFSQDSTGTWHATTADIIPIWQSVRPRIGVVNLPLQLSRLAALDPRRATYQAAYDRISHTVMQREAATHGLTVVEPTH